MGIFINKVGYLRLETTIPIIIALIVVLIIGFSSITAVPVGHVGVVDFFGSVEADERQSGIQLKNPFAGVTMMSVKTQEYTMSFVQDEGAKYGSDVISALTKEGLSVDLDITILYKLQPKYAVEMYKTTGSEYVSVVVRPQIRTAIREVIANYEAKQIYSPDRAKIPIQIFDELEPELVKRGIIIEQVLLRHVQLPPELTISIEKKLTAEQDIERKAFEVEIELQEAQRKRVEAQGIADAQKIIDKTLTQPYLTYLLITHLEDYEGGKIFLPTDLTLDFVYDMNDE